MKSLGLKLQFFYFFIIGISGVTFFFPVWLENRGISFEVIGIIMAMTCVSKVVFGPVAASLSDMGLNAKNIISALGLISILGLACLVPVSNYYVYIVATLVATGGFLSTVPISENLTLCAIKSGETDKDYGQIRAVGTIAYAVLAVSSGLLIKNFAYDGYIIFLMIFCSLMIVLISRTLKDSRNLEEMKATRTKYKTLFKQKDFIAVIVIQSMYYISSGMQTGFGSAHFKNIGIPADVIGYLVIPMIASEAIFFLMAKKYFNKIPYQSLLLISASVSIVRWSVLAFTTSPWIIMCCQLTHALTFAATHLGMMNYIRDVIPNNLATRAQATYDSGSAGILLGLSMIMYGFLYTYFKGETFLFSALFSVIGFIFALKLKGIKLSRRKKEVKEEIVW